MKNVFFTVFILCSLPVFAQVRDDESNSPKEATYFTIGLQSGYGVFRDFATSPLFYTSVPIGLNLVVRLEKSTYETEFGLDYLFGFYNNRTGTSSASSIGNTLSLFYQRLYEVPKLSAEKWRFKAGGQINTLGTFRFNESLQNNSVGYEFVNTLFASGKVIRDVSRTVAKPKKIWFITYYREPRKRILDFQLNVGIVNTNYRNGYAYIDQSSLVNDFQVFGGYEYHWFEGFRMGSVLNYTWYLPNKNAFQLSYVWQALQTGGEVNRFELGSHLLRFSLLFNSK